MCKANLSEMTRSKQHHRVGDWTDNSSCFLVTAVAASAAVLAAAAAAALPQAHA
jgi:hypothetical protein